MPLDILIEGLLFYKASPQNKLNLIKMFAVTPEDFHEAVEALRRRLQSGAVRLIETENDIELVTAPELSEFIETLRKGELHTDIGKAGAETLAIILYKEPVTRADIDRIRGVNSSFILRNLLTRGLVEREVGKGGHYYKIAPPLLNHLGISQKYELPRFAEFMNAIESFEAESTP
ncbi:MAG: SMC-Scp complex subunit ScpB [Patescibacteria group bacterium]